MGAAADQLKTIAIIPVKRLQTAHARLAGSLAAAERRRLAEAMFLDTLTKLRRSACLDETVVVTADDSVARQSRWLGHSVLKQSDDAGHPQAASAGARWALEQGGERVAMLPVDCPLLDTDELDDRLGQTPRAALIVPDTHGSGTNALVLSPPDAFAPAFGPDSCARHVSAARSAGVSFALEPIDTLAQDLDTPEDMAILRDALILTPAAAPRTAQVLWDLSGKQAAAAA